jgi:hypothetical protein
MLRTIETRADGDGRTGRVAAIRKGVLILEGWFWAFTLAFCMAVYVGAPTILFLIFISNIF